MSTLAKVKKRAKELGAIVVMDRHFGVNELTVEAPKRMRWEEGLHEFVDSVFAPAQPDYADMLNRMSNVCEPCDVPDCDWCNDTSTDEVQP